MGKNEKSSPRAARIASGVLRKPGSSATAKTLAGSVLTQAKDRPKKKKS